MDIGNGNYTINTVVGSFDSSQYGAGEFASTTVVNGNDVKSTDTIINFSNGKTASILTTYNANGTVTIARTGPDGKSSVATESLAAYADSNGSTLSALSVTGNSAANFANGLGFDARLTITDATVTNTLSVAESLNSLTRLNGSQMSYANGGTAFDNDSLVAKSLFNALA